MESESDRAPKRSRVEEVYSIKISNLSSTVAEDTLQKWLYPTFKKFGRMAESPEPRLCCKGSGNRYAYFNYSSLESAQKAVREMNGKELWDSKICVELQECDVSRFRSSGIKRMRENETERTHAPVMKSTSTSTIKVTNLSKATTQDMLKTECGRFGAITNLKVVEVAGQPKNYAWVNYSDPSSAERAVEGLRNVELQGSKIVTSLRQGSFSMAPWSHPAEMAQDISQSSTTASTSQSSPLFSFALPTSSTVVGSTKSQPSSSIFAGSNQEPGISLNTAGHSKGPFSFKLQHLSQSPSSGRSLDILDADKKGMTEAVKSCGNRDTAESKQVQRTPFPAECKLPTSALSTEQGVHRKEEYLTSKTAGPCEHSEVSSQGANSLAQSGIAPKKLKSQIQFNLQHLIDSQSSKAEAVVTISTPVDSEVLRKSPSIKSQSALTVARPKPSKVEHTKPPTYNSPNKSQSLTAAKIPSGKRKSQSLKIRENFSIKHQPQEWSRTKPSIHIPSPAMSQAHRSRQDTRSHTAAGAHYRPSPVTYDRSWMASAKTDLLNTTSARSPSLVPPTTYVTHQFHFLYLPAFNNPHVVSEITEIGQEFNVEISVHTNTHGLVKIQEFAKEVQEAFKTEKVPVVAAFSKQLSNVQPSFEWEALDGELWMRMPAEVNTQLNLQYSPAGRANLEFGGKKYDVNFSELTITDQFEENSCTRQLRPLKPIWCYHKDDDFDFVPIDGQHYWKAIEDALLFGSSTALKIEGQSCVVDFDKMQIISLSDEQRLPIIRDPPAVMCEYEFTIGVSGVEGIAQKALEALKEKLKSRVTTSIIDVSSIGPNWKYLLFQVARQYCVQVQMNTPTTMQLTGTEEHTYLGRVCHTIERSSLHIQKRMVQQLEFKIPPEWEPRSEAVALIPVERNSAEWKRIHSLMLESVPTVCLVKIERIQNRPLWKRFCFGMTEMQDRNQELNEKSLFHGTRERDPNVIINSDKGFDFRYARPGLWGTGAYFAVSASYSDRNYAFSLKQGCKQLLIAKVLTGDSVELPSDRSLTKPPLKRPLKDHSAPSGSVHERYDTVNGVTGSSQIYVVYDHEKAYPDYLVTYRDRHSIAT